MKSQLKKEDQLPLSKLLLVLEKGLELLSLSLGPEGGLSPAEIENFEAKGAVLAGLGPRILRAETAPTLCAFAISVLLELEK